MRRLNLTGKQQPGAASVGEGLSGFGGAAQSQLTTLLGSTFGQGLSSLTKGGWVGGWAATDGEGEVPSSGGDAGSVLTQGPAGRHCRKAIGSSWVSIFCPRPSSPRPTPPHPTPPHPPHPKNKTKPSAGVKNLLAGEQQAAVTVAVEALMEGRPNPETDAYAVFDPKARRAGRACCTSARAPRQGSARGGRVTWPFAAAQTRSAGLPFPAAAGARRACAAAGGPLQGVPGVHAGRGELPGVRVAEVGWRGWGVGQAAAVIARRPAWLNQ